LEADISTLRKTGHSYFALTGVVLVRQAELGEVVQPGAPIVTPADLEHIWVRAFRNLEESRCALAEFHERYNRHWIVQRPGYLTPAQARQQFLAQGVAA